MRQPPAKNPAKPQRPPSGQPQPEPAGLAARDIAVRCLVSILHRGRPLDEAFELAVMRAGLLEARDRAFARLVVMTVLRRKGELSHVVSSYLEKRLPTDTGRLRPILLAAAAQLLVLDTPPHAAISLAVDQCRGDPKARRFDRLTNAVLRKVAATGKAALADIDPVTANMPFWLLDRWTAAYGEDQARVIATASLAEASLDLSVKSEAAAWAERLGGIVLSTGTVRLPRAAAGRVESIPGYADGDWWVQDAAAALPVRLLGDVAGRRVADLCAAPGGKTAQLLAAGANVTAVDYSAARLDRLRENLARLLLTAEVVETDVLSWEPGVTFDAVLLDAPCSATGTVRRHPDILHLRRKDDTTQRVAVQRRLLEKATPLVAPGGFLVYCTCSLEPEEGEAQITRFLEEHPDFTRVPIAAGEAGIDPDWISRNGDLRTLPFHLAHAEPGLSGLDGFYAARLQKRS